MNSSELKIARIRRGLSSKDMAEKLCWTPTTYNYKENNERKISLKDAGNIAKILNLSPAEILLIFFDIDINSNGKMTAQA